MQGPEAQLWVGLDMMCAHLVVPLLGEVCQQLLLDLGRLVASCTQQMDSVDCRRCSGTSVRAAALHSGSPFP